MTDPIVETHFIFDGHSSTEYGVVIVRGGVHVPLLPKTRERAFTVPTRHGIVDLPPYFEALDIVFDCVVQEQSRSDALALGQQLALLLDPRKGARPLVISDRTGTYRARYSGSLDVTLLVASLEFKLPFRAPSPFPTST